MEGDIRLRELRRSVTDPSTLRPELRPSLVLVAFLVENVTLVRVLLFVLQYPCRYPSSNDQLSFINLSQTLHKLNPLAPNDIYIRRNAQLTSRRYILNIYATNIFTEYFKNAAHSPFFSLQDAVYFIMLPFLVPVIFTF